MKGKMKAVSDMYRAWRLLTDHIEELRTHETQYATNLRWTANVLYIRAQDCINAMRKVAELIEEEEGQ